MTADNSIFIGGKPFMNYVTGVVMQFTTKGEDEVIVKARGKFISRCGNHSYHIRKSRCSQCGYGTSTKTRSYGWMKKKLVTHSK